MLQSMGRKESDTTEGVNDNNNSPERSAGQCEDSR